MRWNVALPGAAALLGAATAVCGGMWAAGRGGIWSTLALSFGATAYHLAMRLAVGWLIGCHDRRFTGKSWWFRARRWEAGLYRALRVRAWKGKVPTYVPASFDLGRAGPEAVLRAMCAAELTHEVIIALGYLTLLMAGLCDDVGMGLGLFGGTAFAAGLFDMVFVIIQRYNRPRLRRVMELQAARRRSGC